MAGKSSARYDSAHMIVLAHRGFTSRTHGENTLPAFVEAISQGADGLELDVRLSKDKELVVIHDANLHRVAGDAHKVIELTADELRQIPLRYGGHIPTVNEVTAAIHAPAVIDFEIKHREAALALAIKLKTSASLRERAIVSSFSRSTLELIHRECPEIRTIYLIQRWPLPFRGRTLRARVRRLRPWGVAFPVTVLNARRVTRLRRMGVHVGAWDMRSTAGEARKAARLGLDVAIVKHISAIRPS